MFMNCIDFIVAARENLRIVIAHPGQDVELFCNVTVDKFSGNSANQSAAWLVDGKGPYAVNTIRDGTVSGYTTTLGSNNLAVQNIIMNDHRNNSKLKCVIITLPYKTVHRQSDPYILYVAGE